MNKQERLQLYGKEEVSRYKSGLMRWDQERLRLRQKNKNNLRRRELERRELCPRPKGGKRK